ncbi:hypothetical protein KY331_06090 [Candidatus Woesearchaeota archaeon]|nr:hypothetical protein [Candidatus Woesearchaeota archaeon]
MRKFFVGFDIGSDAVHAVVLNQKGDIVYSPKSLMHFGNPTEALKELYEDIYGIVEENDVAAVAFTGSVGELIAKTMDAPFYYDTTTIPAGAEVIAPEAEYIFHMGSKDPYFFEREVNTGKTFVSDHGTGTKCGGGSGILINKQVRRFFAENHPVKLEDPDTHSAENKEAIKRENRKTMQEQVEKIHGTALESIGGSSKDIDVGGRCGVVIQSDMIHLQNSGEQIPNILKGMYVRTAKNYTSDVIRTRQLDQGKKAITTGGVFNNEFMIDALSEQLGIKLERPDHFEKIGAVGAALKAIKEGKESRFDISSLESVVEAQKQEIQFAPALSSALDKIHEYPEEQAVRKTGHGLIVYKELQDPTDVVIGVDGGSTTTKALIADASNLGIIAEICLDTDGKPLETAQKIFGEIRKHLGKNLKIKGMAYTGSSGAFYHKLFTDFKKSADVAGTDIVKDEITCHAYGVKHFNEKVDTIFECGGQDAKYTRFNPDGTVKRAKMNLSCMAGTGQSMKNMLDMLGFDFKSFKDYALKAKRTPVADETCAIFTEAGILKLVALGFPKEEVAAATAYGFMGGYANKFVGNERFGEFASAQGGPFKGLECLAALALHTGTEVHAFPHRQLFGAFGAAITIYNEIKAMEKAGTKSESKFRGLDIADMTFEKRVESCSSMLENSCGTRDCKLQVYKLGEDEIYSGGLCPTGNIDASVKRAPNYVAIYKRMLDAEIKKFGKILELDSDGKIADSDKPRILIPRSLTFLNEKGVFYTALYSALGFEVVVSPESDDEIANLGIAHSHSETCYPAKLANGHAALLAKYIRKGKDKLLLVNPISARQEKRKFCPYVSASGFVAKDALHLDNEDVLLPVLHFEDPTRRIEDAVHEDLSRTAPVSKKQVREAVKIAEKAQKEFLDRVYERGKSFVKNLKQKGEKVFIGIGRGYTVLDDKASSKVHELFASHGFHFVPSFFLRQPDIDLTDIAHNMYWFQGQSMLKYGIKIALDPQLYPVRETNFNCGTDSMILYHEGRIMDAAENPFLVLQTDGHNSNAQFGTRTLANNEVVKHHKPKEVKLKDFKFKNPEADLENRIIGIPNMGTASTEILASVFKSIGYKAEVMPSRTEKARHYARKVLQTNNCEPMSFVSGDSIAWLHDKKEKGYNANKELAIFMPQAAGPCRLGQYHVILRMFYNSFGFDGVPIIAPSSHKDYEDIPVDKSKVARVKKTFFKALVSSDILQNAVLRTRPYEENQGDTDRAYKLMHSRLLRIVEAGCDMKELQQFMQDAAKQFHGIPKSDARKPRVDMIGEIFVRSHPKANQDSIRMLEANELEVYLPLTSDWTRYINQNSQRKFWHDGKYWDWFKAKLKGKYMSGVEARLFEPFREFLAGREPSDALGLITHCQNELIYHPEIEGESPISIGETYEFIKGDGHAPKCGIYHVGPFGCMQETTAISKIQALIQRHRKGLPAEDIKGRMIPYMSAAFGESELPNLDAEMAAFAEKCHLKKEMDEP